MSRHRNVDRYEPFQAIHLAVLTVDRRSSRGAGCRQCVWRTRNIHWIGKASRETCCVCLCGMTDSSKCKPNVGHSEGASGVTGVIKGVLALQHQTIPPNINFQTPNPKRKLGMSSAVIPPANQKIQFRLISSRCQRRLFLGRKTAPRESV